MKEWRLQDSKPVGKVVEEVGMAGNLAQETIRLLKQYECYDEKYSQELEKKYEEGWTIPEEERKKREDLTDWCIFTIDPKTARDLDDALSIRKLDK